MVHISLGTRHFSSRLEPDQDAAQAHTAKSAVALAALMKSRDMYVLSQQACSSWYEAYIWLCTFTHGDQWDIILVGSMAGRNWEVRAFE